MSEPPDPPPRAAESASSSSDKPRVNTLMLELACKNLDGNAVVDAYTHRGLQVKITASQAQAKSANLVKAFNKVLSNPPTVDPKRKNAMPTYTFDQLLDKTAKICTEEELDVILSFFRKSFSRPYDDAYYTGEFSAGGEREGQGILEFENGQRYEGEWQKDKFHGHGTYTLNDGASFDGEWRNGKQMSGNFNWPVV